MKSSTYIHFLSNGSWTKSKAKFSRYHRFSQVWPLYKPPNDPLFQEGLILLPSPLFPIGPLGNIQDFLVFVTSMNLNKTFRSTKRIFKFCPALHSIHTPTTSSCNKNGFEFTPVKYKGHFSLSTNSFAKYDLQPFVQMIVY